MHVDLLLPAIAALLVIQDVSAAAKAAKHQNAILLSEVRTLTLRAGRQTAHRRVPAVPQLKCVSSPSICALYTVDTLQCVNQGSSYGDKDIQWACTASLPSTLRLGSTEVFCEGYNSPDDPYVLKGSCGVEYRLSLTEEGERQYPDLVGAGGFGGGKIGRWDIRGVVFGIVFLGVLFFILLGLFRSLRENWGQDRGGAGGGGWGGWGGGGGGGGSRPPYDPPPPYDDDGFPRGKSSRSQQRQQQQGWRPGFWSGLATGAAAAYMAGNRDRQNERRDYGGINYGSARAPGLGSGSRSGSLLRASSSSSDARHESTGFGSTNYR